jgi:hypothetical protein
VQVLLCKRLNGIDNFRDYLLIRGLKTLALRWRGRMRAQLARELGAALETSDVDLEFRSTA